MKPKKPKSSEVAAIEDCKRTFRQHLSRGQYKEAAEDLNQLGNQFRLLGNYEDALEQHEQEVELCKSHNKGDKLGLGIAYRNIAEVYIDMKKPEDAIRAIKKYLEIARDLNSYAEEQRAMITMGRAFLTGAELEEEETAEALPDYKRKEHYKAAEEWFRKAYGLLTDNSVKEQLGNDKEFLNMKCNNCQNLGIVMELQGNGQALRWFEKAVEIGRKEGLLDYLFPCHVAIANLHLKGRQERKALAAVKESLKVALKLGSLAKEMEAKLLEAKVLFCSDEVEAGKNLLKKLRKKVQGKSSLAMYLEELDALLIPAVKLCRKANAVADETSDSKLLRLHESMGDNYAELNVFHVAVNHYLEAVQLAEKLKMTNKKISSLYFSVAECFKDCGEYEKALMYYDKEMGYNKNNPIEKFRTQTNMVQVVEKIRRPDSICRAHEDAITFAKETKSNKSLSEAYTSYGNYLKSSGKKTDGENYLKMAEQLNNRMSQDINSEEMLLEGEGEEDESEDEMDIVDLDNLSSDGESGEEEDSEVRNIVQSKRRVTKRKNEAGETPLHLAAKRGDLAAVKKYLKEGLEVNARDTAGWTPLHEAANFGFEKVVKELIEAGARVNDPGGELCDGITPLHDALSNGHFAVAHTLLDSGAKVCMRDAKKNFPLDHLIIWKSAADEETLQTYYEEYKALKHKIKGLMTAAGRPYSREDEKRAVRSGRAGNASPEFRLLPSSSASAPIPIRIASDNFDPDNATKEYKNTMASLLRTKKGKVGKEERPKRAMSPGPRTGLIPNHLDVHEDWMVEDVESQVEPHPHKRWKGAVVEVENKEEEEMEAELQSPSPPLSPIITGGNDWNEYEEFPTSQSPPLFISHDCEIMPPSAPSPLLIPDSDSEEEIIHVRRTNKSKAPPPKINSPPKAKKPSPKTKKKAPSRGGGDVLRFKIKVLDETLLVPVDKENQSQPISWLCEQAATRYKELCGVKPVLTLRTAEGATLWSSDPIELVIGAEDSLELTAAVSSFDTPVLSKCFQSQCSHLGLVPPPLLLDCLKQAETTNILDVGGHYLRGKIGAAFFASLSGAKALKELRASECSILDDDLPGLGKIIWTLGSVCIVDLGSNGITELGLRALVQRLKEKQGVISNSIKEIKLDYNPLGNGAAQEVTALAALLPSLSKITLAHTNLTPITFYEYLGADSICPHLIRGVEGGEEDEDFEKNHLDVEHLRELYAALTPPTQFGCDSP